LILLCAGSIDLSAQQGIQLSGTVVDIITKEPIEGVNILEKQTYNGTSTDSTGAFTLTIQKQGAELKLSHLVYQNNELVLKDLDPDQPLTIYLTPKSYELSEAVITAKRQFAYSILDFTFIGRDILLLANKHRNNSLELILISDTYDTLARLTDLPGKRPASILKDCFDNCHILFRTNAYQVFYDEAQLELIYPTDKEKFVRLMQNCLFSTNDHIFFKRNAISAYKHLYIAIDKETSEVVDFITDIERDKMFALNDEMSFINRNPDAFPSSAGRSLAIAYAHKIAFKAATNYLEKIGDTIYYFNHGKGQIELYDLSLDFHRDFNIIYHADDSWEEEIFVDKALNKAYTCYEKRGRIEMRELNLDDGTARTNLLIPITFPEKIKVNNGYVYFLYKEAGNIWARKELYRLKL
jgi:hypothetical protein